MVGNSWYYAIDGNEVGPVSAEVLRAMLSAGQLRPVDHVWQEGMAEWEPAGSVPALASPPPRTSGMPPPLPAAALPIQPGPDDWMRTPQQGYAPKYLPAAKDPRTKAVSAAKASWLSIFVAIILNFVSNVGRTGRTVDRVEMLSIGCASLLIYVFGLGCGIYALTQVGKFGPQGIRTPAIVGVILNSLIIIAFLVVILAASMLK